MRASSGTPEQEELVQAVLSNSSAPAISLSKSSAAIPITLRLATRVLQGASAEAVASAIAAVQLEFEAVSESEEFAAALRRSFIEERPTADERVLMLTSA